MSKPIKQIVQTRNLFIDTEETLIGESRDVTINLPQDLMSCAQSQSLRVTLQSFNMRKSWYGVNKYNDSFYIVGEDSATNNIIAGKVQILNGNYQSFTEPTSGLCEAIEIAVSNTLKEAFGVTAIPTVEWDDVTNLLTVEFDTTGATPSEVANLKFVSFTINNYQSASNGIVQQIIGFDPLSAFQDNYELMGGCNEQRNDVSSFENLRSMFAVAKTAGNNPKYTMTGFYNASLTTEEAIYVRSDLNSTSYQTAGFDTGSLFPYVVNSQILAKIPIQNPQYAYQKGNKEESFEYEANCSLIDFTDNGNSIYSVMLNNKRVSSIRLFVTDSYGRLIPEISAEQIGCSALHFTCSLRVDVFE